MFNLDIPWPIKFTYKIRYHINIDYGIFHKISLNMFNWHDNMKYILDQ